MGFDCLIDLLFVCKFFYVINKNKLELVATMIVDYNNGQPKYTEKRMMDGDLVVVQDNMFENEMSFDGWNMSMLGIL